MSKMSIDLLIGIFPDCAGVIDDNICIFFSGYFCIAHTFHDTGHCIRLQGIHLAACDAYVNIAGGMKMTEPAIDLGISLAVVSSCKDIIIPDSVIAFGEVGLSGEVRAVSMAGQRVAEAKKLGFDTVILPEVCKSSVGKVSGINLVYVSWIQDAIRYIMKNNYKL